MKKWMLAALAAACLTGCKRYEPITEIPVSVPETITSLEPAEAEADALGAGMSETEEETAETIAISTKPERVPVKVKGIYVSAYVAGTKSMMDQIIREVDQTELNAVVIDVKDDNGRVTFDMDSPTVKAIGAVDEYITDMPGLADQLKSHGIYMIARIPAFRDPYLAEAVPDWCCKLANGSVYRDKKGLAWVNPYKKEVWDYLIEIAKKAGELGFDEIQFDYIRFCTEGGMAGVVFDEADTGGKNRQEIIQEFVEYASEELTDEGLFLAADVFGTIIGGGVDAELVGQSYGLMSTELDYICPMIYPSHYGDGNFGIAHPDTQPYDTILAALVRSREDLNGYTAGDKPLAVVRPWLQDFTASYLAHHLDYGPKEIRAQIQAVYDAGYDEWILWSAANKYHYDGLLTPEAAAAEEEELAGKRAGAMPETIMDQTEAPTA